MKQKFIIVIIFLAILACLLGATIASVNRAKQPQSQPQAERPTQGTAWEETQEMTEPETIETTETTETTEQETTQQDTADKETEAQTSVQEQTEPPTSAYDIDFELEAELGCTFRDVYTTVVVTGASSVWVRTEPSVRGGSSTCMNTISGKEGTTFTCIGWGEDWHRLLIDGKVYYMSAAYLEEVTE